jgi:hypothetical protein
LRLIFLEFDANIFDVSNRPWFFLLIKTSFIKKALYLIIRKYCNFAAFPSFVFVSIKIKETFFSFPKRVFLTDIDARSKLLTLKWIFK